MKHALNHAVYTALYRFWLLWFGINVFLILSNLIHRAQELAYYNALPWQ